LSPLSPVLVRRQPDVITRFTYLPAVAPLQPLKAVPLIDVVAETIGRIAERPAWSTIRFHHDKDFGRVCLSMACTMCGHSFDVSSTDTAFTIANATDAEAEAADSAIDQLLEFLRSAGDSHVAAIAGGRCRERRP
jgi:hypothetical protein